jgi:hypothetical protein
MRFCPGLGSTPEGNEEQGERGGILVSASISRATSFHFGGDDGESSAVFTLILMGLRSSSSEKTVDDVGERMTGYGDFIVRVSPC